MSFHEVPMTMERRRNSHKHLSVDHLSSDERQRNHDADDANDPQTGATVRSSPGRRSPDLL
jgi:hypothetical protein